MRGLAVWFFILMSIGAPAAAQTQLELNEQACAARDKAEKQLQKTVDEVKTRWKGDAAFIAKFDLAQEAWRKFADAQIEMIFPAEDKSYEYGSVYPMCDCSDMAAIIRDRIKQLRPWTKPSVDGDEGDLCPVGG